VSPPAKIIFLSDTWDKSCGRWARLGRVKLSLGSKKTKKRKRNVLAQGGRQPRKPRFVRAPHPPEGRDLLVQSRAEAEAAITEARRSHERLRQAVDLLPQGIVILDPEGRYVLWNKQYSEIYSKTADLFQEGARL
jgi:PAS domain-containing protein